jgi:hypothetical protein
MPMPAPAGSGGRRPGHTAPRPQPSTLAPPPPAAPTPTKPLSQLIDFGAYKAHITGFWNLDLTYILFSMPVGLILKDQDSGEYAYSLLAWHERLLYPEEFAEAERAAARARAEQRVERLVGGLRGLLRVAS